MSDVASLSRPRSHAPVTEATAQSWLSFQLAGQHYAAPLAQVGEVLRDSDITPVPGHARAVSRFSREEILHIRHHSLFTPRDFDLSPYFRVVKPTLEYGFDYKRLKWESPGDATGDPDHV